MGKKSRINRPVTNTKDVNTNVTFVGKRDAKKRTPQSLTPIYFFLLFLETIGALSYLIPFVLIKTIFRYFWSMLKNLYGKAGTFLENSRLLFSIMFTSFDRVLQTPIHFHLFSGNQIKKQKRKNNPLKKRKKQSFFVQLKKHRILYHLLFNRYSLTLGLLILFAVFFFYSYMLVTAARNLPSPEKLSESNGPLTTELYDRNGKLLYRLYEGKNRTLVKLDTLPDYLVKATVAIEDKHFYTHPGVDFEGIARAAYQYIQEGEIQGGGSTITQQLIKNTLLTPEQTFKRKAKEVILAFWTERIFSKQDILQMYFNEVPYGGPAWGIVAAAQTYFDKTPQELDLAEAAYLAGLPASPTTYSPYGSNPEMAKQRQLQVLRRMVEDGYISQLQADQAAQEELKINPPIAQIQAPHFVMYVRSLLSQKYGERMVSQGGLKVTTSLDLNLQQMAEQVVATQVAQLSALNVSNGAAMITDAKNGQILAMVGSKDYFDQNGGNFNVTIARRQPGSSIKPITYATGFKQGYTPGTLLLDAPVSFRNAWENYSPVNYDGRFHGAVTIRTSLGSSYNIPAVKMLSIVTIPEMISTAKDLGITTFDQPDRYGLSLTLGGGEVKMVDMMGAYGAFAQGGIHFAPEPILKVLDSQNEVLEDNEKPEGKRVLSAEAAYMINDILADNRARTPAFGPNSLLNIPGHIVSVKTGTTDSKRDNWTFGYTPEYVVGVWVGNNNNTPMNPSLTSGVTGAAPIWNGIITNLLRDRPNLAFDRPSGITEGMVDGKKDLVFIGQKPKSILGFKQAPDPTGKNANITFTDPFSSLTVDPNKLNQFKPVTTH